VHLTTITDLHKINTKQEEYLVIMSNIRELVSLIHALRKEKNFRVRQPLYADFSEMKDLDEEMIQMIQAECNLLSQDLSKTEGEIWENTDYFGKIKVDMVIDDDLAVMGFTRDFERAVQDFRKKQGFRPNQIVSMRWQIKDATDDVILRRVLEGINWSRLSVEIKWADDLDPNLDKKIEVKGLVTLLVD
jgi:hypothetical protein